MKFYSSNIDKILKGVIDGSITSILFHGPDNGVISDAIELLSKKLSKQIRKISEDEIDDVASSLSNMSFFSESEIIKINVKQIKLDNTLKNIVTQRNHNFPVFVADELEASNSFRKFFESGENIASVGCYQDEEINIKKIISNIVSKSGKRISLDALNFLSEHIRGNRDLIKSEVIKLILYKGDDVIIDLDDAINACSSADIADADKLAISFAKKDSKKYLEELENLLARDVSSIWIIRNLARFYMNLLDVKLNEKFGINIDSSISKLKPKPFFKTIPEFKNIAKKISLSEISKILKTLTECEIYYKRYSNIEVLDKIYLSNFVDEVSFN